VPSLHRPSGTSPRPLAELVSLLGDSAVGDDVGGIAVTGVTHDSRAVQPGDLYAALPGASAHGADFAEDARTAGAVAMLTDRPGPHPLPAVVLDQPRTRLGEVAAWVYGDPSSRLDVIGITGTNGKTTSAYLVEAGLAAAGRGTGLIGTVETRAAGEVIPSAHTTPEATDLQALLALMEQRGVSGVAMEVSSHGLALGRVDGVRFAAAVFTNLSQDHLDFHADMDDYFKAKASLFDPKRSAVAVINVDDEHGRLLLHRTRCPVVTTSAEGASHADWVAREIVATAAGTTLRVVGPGVDRRTHIALPGAYNVANALGAVAALVSIGVDAEAALAGIEELRGVPGRVEPVGAGQPWLAVVDYAHTPDAVASVLRTLRPLTAGRLIVVLGCGGDRDHAKRPLMGIEAAAGADVTIVTSDNPRSEDPLLIVDAVMAGAMSVPGADVRREPDREQAIALACTEARPGDTVLVAGKGHEQGQIFADEVVAFDDRVVLRECIERLRA
jgi:UDP-N-acetylmuramoyl-L-alanyl-D-glutamate--2,6-diaminopimelate ligase